MSDKDNASLAQEIQQKIDREHVLIQGAQAMSMSTDNNAVRQRLEAEIRGSNKNISYLEDRLKQLLQSQTVHESRSSGSPTRQTDRHSLVNPSGQKFPKRREIPSRELGAPDPPPKDGYLAQSLDLSSQSGVKKASKQKHNLTRLGLSQFGKLLID